MGSDSLNGLNLGQYPLDELIDLKDRLEQELAVRQEEAKKALVAEFEEKARELGLDLNTLMGKRRKGAPRGKVAAKYRNDRDPSQTWTGRGKKPKWLAERIEQGASLDNFLIG